MGGIIRTAVAALFAASLFACGASGDDGIGTTSNDDTSARPAPTTDGVVVGPEATGPWVYSNDFSVSANPNGAWSVGTKPSPTSAFSPFVLSRGVLSYSGRCGLVERWSSADGAQVWKNLGGRTCEGAANGQISMRPTAGETAVIRWVAPASAVYRVHIEFVSGAAGTMHGYAHVGADVLVDAATSTSPSFSGSRTLRSGEALDVELDAAGAAESESTPITLTIARE